MNKHGMAICIKTHKGPRKKITEKFKKHHSYQYINYTDAYDVWAVTVTGKDKFVHTYMIEKFNKFFRKFT